MNCWYLLIFSVQSLVLLPGREDISLEGAALFLQLNSLFFRCSGQKKHVNVNYIILIVTSYPHLVSIISEVAKCKQWSLLCQLSVQCEWPLLSKASPILPLSILSYMFRNVIIPPNPYIPSEALSLLCFIKTIEDFCYLLYPFLPGGYSLM